MSRQLKSVAQFADESPFSQPQIRWFVFQSKENGLDKSGAVVRIGRRVYIDPAAFDRWIDAQQTAQVGAA